MSNNIKTIGIIGLGFVGNAIYESFKIKVDEANINVNFFLYDKYKNIGSIDVLVNTDVLFMALPTYFNENTKNYDYESIYDTCSYLKDNNYSGVVILKSTIEPNFTNKLKEKYNLDVIHNPEFLTARNAFNDFHNQKHIVLGKCNNCCDLKFNKVFDFYKQLYDSEISVCASTEAECMKLFCNNFYAVKVQLFNEFYLLSEKLNTSYNNIVDLMLKNNWINPMHTMVPGPDSKLSYGGACFPKDTKALLEVMKKNNVPNKVLLGTVTERDEMRSD